MSEAGFSPAWDLTVVKIDSELSCVHRIDSRIFVANLATSTEESLKDTVGVLAEVGLMSLLLLLLLVGLLLLLMRLLRLVDAILLGNAGNALLLIRD